MIQKKHIQKFANQGRTIAMAKEKDDALGYLKLLPGTWRNVPNLVGHGWNMIALPFVDPNGGQLNYRLLVNQYNEEHTFTLVDKGVPNRGISEENGRLVNSDQFIVTLDYVQAVVQIAADDFPKSGLAGPSGLPIHHEPGLFLQMANEADTYKIARLSSIPHGNSLLALGKVTIYDGAPNIPEANGLPIGVPQDLDSPYLAPYKHYNDQPFQKVFNPVHPNELLKAANQGVDIKRTTELHFDTQFATGGIHNIPFIKKQADASEMSAKFWIQELEEKDANGEPKLRLQYTQTVMLDFFKSPEGGLIKWPHVSINTMEKIS
jgi:hypothetical protein